MQGCGCWRYLFCPKIAPITELFDFGVLLLVTQRPRTVAESFSGLALNGLKFNGRTDPALHHRFSVEGFPAPYNL